MTQIEATEFNKEEAALFVQRNPGYVMNRQNLQIIGEYLERNGIDKVVSAITLEKAVKRLDSYGLLERRAPTPTPQPPAREVNLAIEQTPTTGPRIHTGIDRNGRPREYTDAEVERLTADEFRGVFQLNKPDTERMRAWGR
jgi:hypothetical protein